MKRLIAGLLVAVALASSPVWAQELSSQVLRLLTRNNYWSAINTYAAAPAAITTLKLERTGSAATTCTDGFENRGGNLYFNCNLVPGAAGAGTVSSVGLTVPSWLTVAGSPVTTSGTLAVTTATGQTQNEVLASPNGSSGAVTLRALVDADVPDNITINGTNNVTWASVNKSGSSLADLATRSASDLSSGTLAGSVFPAVLPAVDGSALTNLTATNLASGTVPAGRMPGLTGDITSSAGTVATTLAVSGVTAGSYGSGSAVPVITVDAKGRITAVSTSSTSVGGTVAVANGGTGIASYAVGDLLYASGATALSKLADVAVGNVLISGGITTAPSWGKVSLTAAVSGVLPVANGGTALSGTPTNGQVPVGNGTGFTLAALTGTANQVVVTNGAGTITLSTPQSIGTTSTPQFARMGLGTGAGAAAVLTLAGQRDSGFINAGNCGAALTLNFNSGEIQKTTLNAATCTIALTNPIAGNTYVLYLLQDATGGRLITWPGTVKWKAGSAPTLTVTANKIDKVYLLWDGTSYLGTFDLNF